MQRFPHCARQVMVSFGVLAALSALTGVPPVHAGTPSSRAVGSAASTTHPPPGEAVELVALLIGDTNDPRIGRAVAKDLEYLRQALRSALGSRLRIKVLQGDRATAGKICSWFADPVDEQGQRLRIGRHTNLLCYFSGHGAMRWGWASRHAHYLCMANRSGVLFREQLLALMMQKRPRGMMLLTDCCSAWDLGITGPIPVWAASKGAAFAGPSDAAATSDTGIASPDHDTVCSLLLRPRLVDITAAEDGATANGPPTGSSFTKALLKLFSKPVSSFDRNGDGIVQWDEFFPKLVEETRDQSLGDGVANIHVPRKFAIDEQIAADCP
jgi:hypothetical protein